jgi:hypothetical protein
MSNPSGEMSIKLMVFSGKQSDWDDWFFCFESGAAIYRYKGILDGRKPVSKISEYKAIKTDTTDPVEKRVLLAYWVNSLAFSHLVSKWHPQRSEWAWPFRRCHCQAPPTTFLFAIGPAFTPILPIQITRLLRAAVLSNPTPSGLLPSDINAKSLRATGAMALINRNVDLDRLRLIGRWKSDAVLRYLHFQAHDIMSDYSSLMIAGSNFCLIPTMPDASLPTFH